MNFERVATAEVTRPLIETVTDNPPATPPRLYRQVSIPALFAMVARSLFVWFGVVRFGSCWPGVGF